MNRVVEATRENVGNSAMLDQDSLTTLRASMGERFGLMVQYFVEDMCIACKDLPELVAAGRLDDARRMAHSMKSSSALFGARQLSGAAQELEDALRAQMQAVAGDRLQIALSNVHESLKSHVAIMKALADSGATGAAV